MTVLQILAYAAGKSNAGGSVWYGNVKPTQELAKNVFMPSTTVGAPGRAEPQLW